MFVNRPSVDETEEDLLNFQRDFLAGGSQPAVKVIKNKRKSKTELESNKTRKDVVELDDRKNEFKRDRDLGKKAKIEPIRSDIPESKPDDEEMEKEIEKHDTHITAVLSKIEERNTFQVPVMFPSHRTNAFPSVFQRKKKEINTTEKPKKSIFAQQFMNKSLKDYGEPDLEEMSQSSEYVEPCLLKPLPETISLDRLKKIYPESNVISGQGLAACSKSESLKIHEENLQRLSLMSEQEVFAEKMKLASELDPKLMNFLRNRAKQKPVMKEEKFLQDLAKQRDLEESPGEQEVELMVVADSGTSQLKEDEMAETSMKKYAHMDIVETEKLEWMEMIPQKQRTQIKLSNRFDFDGNVIDSSTDIPTHVGLHHHGDDPDLPGYTLQELFILSRSNFTQQRVFAATLLGKIMGKAKHGCFIEKVEEPVLENLLQSGILFLLRWSLDEQSETLLQSSVFALYSLLCSAQTETCHDFVFLTNRGCEMPKLAPDVSVGKDENDYEIAQKDVIRGLIGMKILSRLRYILEVCHPPTSTVNHCLGILIRIARHSISSSTAIYECPRLIQYIMQHLVLTSGREKDDYSLSSTYSSPFPKAAKLIRTLCMAGRHLTSQLLNDFSEMKTILFKFIGSLNTSNEISSNFDTECEVWKLWIQCCSYGFLCDIFSELFQIIVGHIQFFTTLLSTQSKSEDIVIHAKRLQLVVELCNSVIVSTTLSNMAQWKEISEQLQLIGLTISDSRELRVSFEMQSALSTVIDFLTSYCRQLTNDSDALKYVSYSEKLCFNFLPVVSRHVETKSFSERVDLQRRENVSSLPELNIPTDACCLKNFQFLSSYLECSVSVCNLNKNCCSSFEKMITYLAENCKWMITQDEGNPTFFMRCKNYCLYWAVNLYTLLVTNSGNGFSHYGLFYYTAAFRCFNQLSTGDEHMMHHLLSNILFHSELIRNLITCPSSVTNSLATLNMGKNLSEIAPNFLSINEAVLSNLSAIRSTHMSCLHTSVNVLQQSKARFLHKSVEIESFLLKSGSDDACLPSDWPFIPVLQIYDQSINKGDALGGKSLAHISSSLRYLCLLEMHCYDCLSNVKVTAKIVRLMCVFLAGNDVFLDPPVRECLAFLFSRYCDVKSLETLDFSLPIPGISSFYDFYVSLLEHYEGVSYGDELFSSVILLPVHQRSSNNLDVKKALWCDRANILRILTLPLSKLLIPVSWYLHPLETDFFMIRTYVSALARGYCTLHRNPVPYLIAVHHAAQFLFNKEIDVPPEQRREVCKGILKLKQDEIRKHIFHYGFADADSKTGFVFSDEIDENRRNEIKNFSA